MTTLREAIRRLLSRTQKTAPPDPGYSYTIYWTKMVREWDGAKRRGALAAVEDLISQASFVPNAFERRYHDGRIDEMMHSGESLLALHKVLKAFEPKSP
jgi:hypothetical protein